MAVHRRSGGLFPHRQNSISCIFACNLLLLLPSSGATEKQEAINNGLARNDDLFGSFDEVEFLVLTGSLGEAYPGSTF